MMTRDDELTLPPGGNSDLELTLSGPDAVQPPVTAARIPDQIGGYRILGILGEGGMGVVFEAEQQEPRRRVALKVIRGGELVDDLHIRLFQREVETLARDLQR